MRRMLGKKNSKDINLLIILSPFLYKEKKNSDNDICT